MAVEEKSAEGLSLDERWILQEMYLDEVSQYLDYRKKFFEYSLGWSIKNDSAKMYRDSSEMSFYTSRVLFNKLQEGKK